MNIIIDTSQIIEKLEKRTLKTYLKHHEANGDKLFIDTRVYAELANKLSNPKLKEHFHTLIKEKKASGLIINSRHRYTLKRTFKELFQNLKNKHVHLSTTDRHLIALSVQENAYLDTTDDGIKQALRILKSSKNPWRHYMRLDVE